MESVKPQLSRTKSLEPGVATKKRFIICCDGTWNSSDKGVESIPSNVALLSRMIARRGTIGGDKNKPIEQVVYYQTGIATGPSAGISAKISRFVEGLTGSGLEDHVVQVYHFIATNYEEGDEVLLFGFSRGAYTARAVGGLLTQMGLLSPVDLRFFNQIYRCFKQQNNKIDYAQCDNLGNLCEEQLTPAQIDELSAAIAKARKVESDRLQYEDSGNGPVDAGSLDVKEDIPEPPKWTACVKSEDSPGWISLNYWWPWKKTEPVVLLAEPKKIKIQVIGVWDTVGALGIPESMFSRITGVNKGVDFASTSLNKNVMRAYQALALDEHRGLFSPSLWHLKDPEKDKAGDYVEEQAEDLHFKVDLRQCWFPGYHCDTGGGSATDPSYVGDEMAHKIDQLSLAWMCDQIEGLVTFHRDVAYAFLPGSSIKNWTAKMSKDPIESFPMRFFYGSDLGGGSKFRTPGTYNRKDLYWRYGTDGEPVTIMKKGDVDQHTRERMHPSVKMLIDATNKSSNINIPWLAGSKSYNPKALEKQGEAPKWEFRPSDQGYGAKWIRPAVNPTKGFFSCWDKLGIREIAIDEHVILDRGKYFHNFEARILTQMAKEMLEKRNERLISKILFNLKLMDHNMDAGKQESCGDWWFRLPSSLEDEGKDDQSPHIRE